MNPRRTGQLPGELIGVPLPDRSQSIDATAVFRCAFVTEYGSRILQRCGMYQTPEGIFALVGFVPGVITDRLLRQHYEAINAKLLKVTASTSRLGNLLAPAVLISRETANEEQLKWILQTWENSREQQLREGGHIRRNAPTPEPGWGQANFELFRGLLFDAAVM